VGVLGQDDALDLALAVVVEQAQLDLLGVRREQAKFVPEPSQVAPSG
jgi:hypothetical protein